MLYHLQGHKAPAGIHTDGAVNLGAPAQTDSMALASSGVGYSAVGFRADSFMPIIQAHAARMGMNQRIDTEAVSYYVKEQLTQVELTALENARRVLPGETFIPTRRGYISPGARTVRHTNVERAGRAKRISGDGEDLPRVSTGKSNTDTPAEMFGLAYGWTYDDMLSAMMGGGSLPADDAITARRSFDEYINAIIWRGGYAEDRDENWYGVLNHPNVPKLGATAPLTSASADQDILTMMHSWVTKLMVDSDGIEVPSRILLPLDRYMYISTKKMTEEGKTILELFMEKSKFVREVEPVVDLGLEGESKAVIYDPAMDKMVQDISLDYTPLPVQNSGLNFVVPVVGKVLRFRAFRPKSYLIVDEV